MKKNLLTILALIISIGCFTQNQHYCGYDLLIQQKANNDIQYFGQYQDFFKHCEANFKNSDRTEEVYEIPVVFHIVYNTDSQNLSDEVILDQMLILNQDYRRLNPNADETRDVFIPFAADTEIQFVLATTDPDGNPTTGIEHIFTDETGFPFNIFDLTALDAVKHSESGGADAWDPVHYMNVWICNIEAGFFGGLSGYAYPPNDSPNWPENQGAQELGEEGVVLHYPVVGSNNPNAGDDDFEFNDGGRTLTHEAGHYLGLRHIWGDAIPFLEDGCTVDDGIEDTPNVEAGANFVCDFSLESCETGESALPAMIENYMDYSNDACMNMFTQEQKQMMRFIIEEFRPGLIDPLYVGTNEISLQNSINIYPNPVHETLSIEIHSQENLSSILSIYSISGKLVFQQSIFQRYNQLELGFLNRGVYIIEFNNHNEIYRQKFIKS